MFKPLNAELNPNYHLLALLGAHYILHVSGVRANMLVSYGVLLFAICPTTAEGPPFVGGQRLFIEYIHCNSAYLEVISSIHKLRTRLAMVIGSYCHYLQKLNTESDRVVNWEDNKQGIFVTFYSACDFLTELYKSMFGGMVPMNEEIPPCEQRSVALAEVTKTFLVKFRLQHRV
jgi:hypothetical protein